MPTYEYACKSCGEHLEVVQSFKDEPLSTCPNCGGDLRKVFAPIGISFKGSGFYKTDSRPKSSESKSGEGKSSEAKPKSSESKPAESKPAATGASKSESKTAAS